MRDTLAMGTDDAGPNDYLEFPEPDLVIMRAAKTLVSMGALAERLKERSTRGRFYLIVDFTGMSRGFDAETREKGPSLIEPEWVAGCAYIQAPLAVRLALKVINLSMFLAGRADFPTEFVDSEEAALEAIARFRAESAPSAKSP